jgi:predicted dehydrogenase
VRRSSLELRRLPGRRSGIVNVVQAGLGSWGRSWIGLFSGGSGVELAAVVDPGARLAAGGVPGFAVLEEALAEVACDAVLVVSPPDTHHAVTRAALEAGKHVLCEKPLATSLVDAFDLVDVARRERRVLMVSQNYRYNAPFRTVQRVVKGGHLGELASIRVSCRRSARLLRKARCRRPLRRTTSRASPRCSAASHPSKQESALTLVRFWRSGALSCRGRSAA